LTVCCELGNGNESSVPFFMACYACHLGELEEAKIWLGLAFLKAETPDAVHRLKSKALEEPDLKPIWKDIDRLLR